MTIGEVLTNTSLLLNAEDVPSSATLYERVASYLDSALAELARSFPVQARCKITLTNGEAELPETAMTPRGLYQNGKRVSLVFSDGKILGEDGSYTLVYYRKPIKASEMDRNEELPLPEDLAMALPFYCAAACLMAEDPALYNRMMEQYNTKLAAALGYRPVAEVEGSGSL